MDATAVQTTMPTLPKPGSIERQTPEYLYIELLKRSVSNYIYMDDKCLMKGEKKQDEATGRLVCDKPGDPLQQDAFLGKIWPSKAHTMIGIPRLNNIQACIHTILDQNIPGDFIETGVWRGGACIFMRGILKAYQITNRQVWVADSFEGLPKSSDPKDTKYEEDWSKFLDLAVSLETVQSNFKRYDLLDNQVKFLKGWFKDTLPTAPIEQLALIRLDGDLYESTMDGLNNLYSKLSPGGFVIIDDYYMVEACKEAVHDFRNAHGISEPLWDVPQDRLAAFWQKA